MEAATVSAGLLGCSCHSSGVATQSAFTACITSRIVPPCSRHAHSALSKRVRLRVASTHHVSSRHSRHVLSFHNRQRDARQCISDRPSHRRRIACHHNRRQRKNGQRIVSQQTLQSNVI